MSRSSTATTTNKIEKKDDKGTTQGRDGKDERPSPSSIDRPGGKTLEKTYMTADYYWGAYGAIAWTGVPLWAKFFFQLVFAGTAATIVSGAVAERIKYHSFIIFSFIMAICIYPVVGHWIWGGGWLAAKWTSSTSPAPPRCTRSAAGRPWRASSCSARASASTARTARSTPFPATT